jgi:hypothetical protein
MMHINICDPTDTEIADMLDYCHEYSLSLTKFENVDVSDISGKWDTIATFKFHKDEDALFFKLKYHGKR